MKLTLEPTGQIETVKGTLARVWTGATDAGVPVKVWIACVQPQTADAGQLAAFEAALTAMPYERRLVAFDIRMAT